MTNLQPFSWGQSRVRGDGLLEQNEGEVAHVGQTLFGIGVSSLRFELEVDISAVIFGDWDEVLVEGD